MRNIVLLTYANDHKRWCTIQDSQGVHLKDSSVEEKRQQETQSNADDAAKSQPFWKWSQRKHYQDDEGKTEDGKTHVVPEWVFDLVVEDFISSV